MDLQNTSEHSDFMSLVTEIGLGDVYQSPAYQETMYGYSYAGDISKRDLYIGDKEGITKTIRRSLGLTNFFLSLTIFLDYIVLLNRNFQI